MPPYSILFPLLRSAMFGEDLSGFPELSADQWQELVDLARKQTVLGLLYQGISNLPESYQVPDDVMFSLVAEAERIRKRGYKVAVVAQGLMAKYQKEGLHPIVMKGPAMAQHYPDPLLRQSGDIDLYFPEKEYPKAVELSGKTVKIGDGTLHFMQDGIDVDLHSRFFDVHSGKTPPVPSHEATLLMLSSHILKHAMGPGIGLRQLCDMAMAYQKLQVPAPVLRQCFKDARLEKWNRLLFSFLTEHLGTEPLYDTSVPSDNLLDIISSGGNFGHYAARRDKALAASTLRRKADTALRFVRRLPFSLRYAPKEFFCSVGDLLKGNLS